MLCERYKIRLKIMGLENAGYEQTGLTIAFSFEFRTLFIVIIRLTKKK